MQNVGFPPECSSQHARTHKNVLFIGNSYTWYNDLSGMVKSLAIAAGFNATVRAASGGQFFSNHLSSSYIRSIITEGEWDAIVLQGHSVRSGVHYGYVRVA